MLLVATILKDVESRSANAITEVITIPNMPDPDVEAPVAAFKAEA
jgi:hypothetical protein